MNKEKITQEYFRKNPINFLKSAWPEIYLWDKLNLICEEITKNRRLVIPSGHGIGKTWIAARLALWFLFCFYPAKVITTAPTWSQVEMLLWSEISKAYNTSKFNLGGRLLQTTLKIDEDWFAIGFSTRGKASEREYGAPKFQGFHSKNLLVILDEGPGVEHEIWTSIETLITGENNKIIAIGNPTSPSGDFFNACKSPLWKKIEVSCFDHPNVKENRIIVPGAVTTGWINERRDEWGEDSPLWISKVLGKFPAEGTDTLIPLTWAEACIGLALSEEGQRKLGVDVARFGDDQTVFTKIFGHVVKSQEAVNKKDTSWTSGKVKSMNMSDKFDIVGIDDTGVGGGVTDGLVEDGDVEVDAINFGESAIEDDKFENRKAELYWVLREDIRDKKISLPDDKELINQLCSIKFSFTRKGRIKIESKDEMKKRGFKSPDKADSLAIAWGAGNKKDDPSITIVSLE
jgi:hypothetical protein